MLSITAWRSIGFVGSLLIVATGFGQSTTALRGTIVDRESGEPLAARLYIQSNEDSKWYFARSESEEGSAVQYEKRRGPESVEIHTSLSAHPFVAELPPGQYSIQVERGKEYLTYQQIVDVGAEPVDLRVRLQRWVDMSSHGWYSGETHVHRSVEELPTAMLAEDLNVALPLTYWVTRSHTPPSQGNKNSPDVLPQLIHVDESHVIYPMNTEYEIFTVDGKRHPFGAVFALNHKSVLELGVPPVRRVAELVHQDGGLLELDKHNWPWSMMIVPIMNVDLYELTNNHIWRTEFAFRTFGESPPAYMNIEQDADGMTERGWIDFTFQNYYALLNCNFPMRPTGGTASGVHPVPLGFGRVYVHLGPEFSYDAWMKGLDAGRSFVTTGPMLETRMNDQLPGHSFQREDASDESYQISGTVRSQYPVDRIELVRGDVGPQKLAKASSRKTEAGGWETEFTDELRVTGQESTWAAVRCYMRLPNGRLRFAHTAPYHIAYRDQPMRPRKVEVRYLIDRVRAEIERNTNVLSEDALSEYREALEVYERIAATAR